MSYSEFENFIELSMTPNMNWNIIELYHVKPLSSFDLTSIDQLVESAHYSNIQPLIAKDNRAKGVHYHEHDLVVQTNRVYDYESYKYYFS